MKSRLYLLIIFVITISCTKRDSNNFINWNKYLGDAARTHFTTLDKINKDNLGNLEVAWVYDSPDTGQMQMNPIIVDGVLYGVTAALKAFALNASTGEELWQYGNTEKAWHSTSRGLSYWEAGGNKRIFYTIGTDLIALNAKTGKIIPSFGQNGKVDLHKGLPDIAKDKFIISNTPGTVFENLIIMPVRVSEGSDAAPGDIRAFNTVTGDLEWTFHVIPYPGEEGYESWENKKAYTNEAGIGAGNNWAGMTLDEETGIVYIPTGSVAPDFYGGNRPGSNLYSDCLLALDAITGRMKWYFQFTHHDIWDRDPPAPPNLLILKKGRKKINAIAQVTKQGYVYVFDRKTGEPIYDIEEIPFPASNLKDEIAWPSQPIPKKPKPFVRLSNEITENDVSPYAPNPEELKNIIRNSTIDFYAPPDTSPVLLLPGYDGGAEWGGAGVDPENGLIYINANEMAWMLQMKEQVDPTGLTLGELLFLNNCAVCHKNDLTGNNESGYPSLIGISKRLNRTEMLSMINNGKGMMPGYGFLSNPEKNSLIKFLSGIKEPIIESNNTSNLNQILEPYKHLGYNKFLDANGLPALTPPWGTLSAIDLNNGEFIWQVPLGEIDSLVQLGYPVTGTENYGGPIITENGLIIIAGTKDSKIRIFDRENGNLLWKNDLPASAFATPATYMVGERQFIVLACGGEKLGTQPGNKIVAYALKDN